MIIEDGTIDFEDTNGTEVAPNSVPASCLGNSRVPPEESWKECEMHARNILGEEGFNKFMKDLEEGRYDSPPSTTPSEHKEAVQKVLEKARSTHQEVLDGKRKQKGLFDFGGDDK